MHISRAKLKNVKALKELELEFGSATGKPPFQTLILGMNGTCKTSLLRALALGVCDLENDLAVISQLHKLFGMRHFERKGLFDKRFQVCALA